MIPESQLVEASEQTILALESESESEQLSEARSFTVGVVVTAILVFLGVPLVTFALLAASIASPVLIVVVMFTLARMDRARSATTRLPAT